MRGNAQDFSTPLGRTVLYATLNFKIAQKIRLLVDSRSVLLSDPVRRLFRPSRASTGGALPVNMCGPVAEAGCNWTPQHTPPQTPTAPSFAAKGGKCNRGGCSIQNNDARMERKQEGRAKRRRGKKRGNLGFRKENFSYMRVTYFPSTTVLKYYNLFLKAK